MINVFTRNIVHLSYGGSTPLRFRKFGSINYLDWERFHKVTQFISKSRYSSTVNMKAHGLFFKEHGDPTKVVSLKEVTLEELKPTSVCVKVLGSPINPSDLSYIAGIYAIKPNFSVKESITPGFEGALEVVKVGSEVTKFSQGDLVIVISQKDGPIGHWISHIVVDQDSIIKVNTKNVDLISTIKINPLTAYSLLTKHVELKPGDTVLVSAANSHCGKMILQFARLMKVNAVGIVRDRPNFEELAKYLKELGAAEIIRPEELKTFDFQKQLTNGKLPVLALDCVAGDLATDMIRSLTKSAVYVNYGSMSYKPVITPVASLIFNDVKVCGFWLSNPNNPSSSEMLISKVVNTIMDNKLVVPELTHVNIPNKPHGKDIFTNIAGDILKGKSDKKYVLTFNDE